VFRVILVTAPRKEAERLARRLLEERLVACANLVRDVRSLYWWQGRLGKATETLLILKAPRRNVERLIRRVKELHPYEVPEIVALPVEKAYRPYAEWVEKETAHGR